MAQLADCLTKIGARSSFEEFLRRGSWRCTYDEKFESAKRRKARRAGAHVEDDDTADEWKNLVGDEGFGIDIRNLLKKKYQVPENG